MHSSCHHCRQLRWSNTADDASCTPVVTTVDSGDDMSGAADALVKSEASGSEDGSGYGSSNECQWCTCGEETHSRSCPLNPRNVGEEGTLYREGFSYDDSCNKPPPSKKPKPTNNFKAGDYVCIHSDARRKHHVPCCIAEVVGGKHYRLRLRDGVLLSSCYTGSELTPLGSGHHISLDGWHLSKRVSFRSVNSNPVNLEKSDCIGPIPSEFPIDLTEGSDEMSTASEVHVYYGSNVLCTH